MPVPKSKWARVALACAVVVTTTNLLLHHYHALEQGSGRKRARAPGGQGPRGKKPRAYRAQSFFWDDHVADLTDSEFNAAYRMNLKSFECLLAIVKKYIDPINETKARNSRPKAGRVPVENELACTLRYLAGGQTVDLMMIYGPISRDRVYKAIRRVVKAILA